MTDLKVRTEGVQLETWPNPLPDLYAGEPVMLTTASPSTAGKVIIEGRLSGKPWSTTLELADATEGSGVSKIWARSKIASVEGTRYTGAKEGDVDAQVLTIALDHHLVSRMTSLVAVDVTPSRPSDATLESQAMPTNLPHGWNFEKVFGTDVDDPTIETMIDARALVQLASLDKPATVAGGEGVALPQTDAGTLLSVVLGVLLVAAGVWGFLLLRLRRVWL
jgi:Ca-activated chloride channel family protein